MNMYDDELQYLDSLELELSQQEDDDLKEIENLMKNHSSGQELSSKVWSTIKQEALDSVEQIIGLDDRGSRRKRPTRSLSVMRRHTSTSCSVARTPSADRAT